MLNKNDNLTKANFPIRQERERFRIVQIIIFKFHLKKKNTKDNRDLSN